MTLVVSQRADEPADFGEGVAGDAAGSDGPPTVDEDRLERLLAMDRRSLGALRDVSALLGDLQRMVWDLARQNRELEKLARVDPLTGLPNRRGFEEQLRREEARARREGTRVAVLAIDVQKLKSVNEQFGHGVGDDLLRAVGAALAASARQSDIVARLGGDEFAALLPGASRAGAEIFLQRVRANVRSLLLPSGAVLAVQLWAGIAVRDEADSLLDTLQLADGRLILDKQRSRV